MTPYQRATSAVNSFWRSTGNRMQLAATIAAGLLGTIAMAGPADAAYVRATYSGSVAEAAAPAQAGLTVGTPIDFTVVFDPAKAVDYTADFNANNGTSFSSVKAISLSDDPGAALGITAGGVSFTKFDGLQYGTPFGDCDLADCGPAGLGAGNLPTVFYLNGQFAGIGNILINGLGFSLDADPIADFFTGGFGLAGAGEGPYDFYLGRGDIADPFRTGLAVGNIDLSTLRIAAVPEPASWAMFIGGFGLLGAAARRRRQMPADRRAC